MRRNKIDTGKNFPERPKFTPMKTVIAHPKDALQEAAITAILDALNVPYELEGERPYNPEFVERILAEKEAGKSKVIRPEDLWK